MTFHELRRRISDKGQVPIRWNKSGIIEAAKVTPSGGIQVTNIISGKFYRIPPHYKSIDVTVLEGDQLIRLGDLLPKGTR